MTPKQYLDWLNTGVSPEIKFEEKDGVFYFDIETDPFRIPYMSNTGENIMDNDWNFCIGDVAVVTETEENGDKNFYYGAVKKITITKRGVFIHLKFGPSDNWREFPKGELGKVPLQSTHLARPSTESDGLG